MPNKELSVLLLETDDNRSATMDRIFHQCNLCSKIQRVKNIEEAKDLLEEAYKKSRVTPSLIVAYLKPEDATFIKVMKEHNTFRHIPLIGYSDISSKEDIEAYYKEHINCFIVQPKSEEEFTDTFQNIFRFWGETVKLVQNDKMLV